MAISPEILLIVIFAGLFCGFLNTVASSGSAVSLPILLWLGLHAVDANATNRLPVLIGALTATVGFQRRHAIPWNLGFIASIPVTLGAAIGALISEVIPGHDLRVAITGAVVMALILILTKLKDLLNAARLGKPHIGWREHVLLFLVGIWTGFIVLDSATYMLLVLVLCAYLPLVDANAVKSVLLIPTTLVAMLIFAERGSIDWTLGGGMALGSVAGGYLGARVAISPQAHRWIVGLLVTVITGELIHLALQYYLRLFH